MILSAEYFAKFWGDENLVRMPANAILQGDAHAFLSYPGLPALMTYCASGSEIRMTFCRLAVGPSSIRTEKTVGPELPREWSDYIAIGDEFFCNGSAWWAVHQTTGIVYRIDIELKKPIDFANSSVTHLASTLAAVVEWSNHTPASYEKFNPRDQNWPGHVDALMRTLAEIDPPCMNESNVWEHHLQYIRIDGSGPFSFKKGSRTEGEDAVRIGAW